MSDALDMVIQIIVCLAAMAVALLALLAAYDWAWFGRSRGFRRMPSFDQPVVVIRVRVPWGEDQ